MYHPYPSTKPLGNQPPPTKFSRAPLRMIYMFTYANVSTSSDSSDKLSQQLEILNRFNPHAPSIFPTLAPPFLSLYPSFPPYSQHSIWVQPTYYFGRLRDYTLVRPMFDM